MREPVHADIREMTSMIATTLEYAKGASSQAGRADVDLAALVHDIATAARDIWA